MSNRSFMAGCVIFLGLFLACAVKFILPPCSALTETASGMYIPMKCHWTGQMAMGLGLFISFEGILLGGMRSSFARLGLSLVVMATVVLTIAVPTVLIGVCGGSMMPCRIGTMPVILVICALLFLIALGNVFYLRAHPEPAIVQS